jgi:hypothetical protein
MAGKEGTVGVYLAAYPFRSVLGAQSTVSGMEMSGGEWNEWMNEKMAGEGMSPHWRSLGADR